MSSKEILSCFKADKSKRKHLEDEWYNLSLAKACSRNAT